MIFSLLYMTKYKLYLKNVKVLAKKAERKKKRKENKQ